MDPDTVLETVINLIEDREKWLDRKDYTTLNKRAFIIKMREKYLDLAETAPTIFEKCCEGEFEKEENIQKLEYMIEMSKKIRTNPNKYEDINKEVGAKFAKEYITPVVNKLEKK